MPLNDNVNQEEPEENKPTPPPILHKPGRDYSLIRNIAIAVGILCILAAFIFFTYVRSVRTDAETARQEIMLDGSVSAIKTDKQVQDQIPQVEIDSSQIKKETKPAASDVAATDTPVVEKKEVEKKEEEKIPVVKTAKIKKAKVSPVSGRYTIYVGSYPVKAEAKTKAARWESAGFDSWIVEARGRYRVAIGRFKTEDAARRFISENKEAFGNDFWVAIIKK
ncbi:MAG: SPOR domain-containing protein [Ignavibacteriales bacterium]|nr:SPOR domain-containing protein [Ignavibacteriales bacterium]